MGELTAAVAFCVATSWWMSRWFSCSSARRLSLSTGPPITALSCLFCGPPCNKWILNLRRATSHTHTHAGKRLQAEIWGRLSPEILQGNISKKRLLLWWLLIARRCWKEKLLLHLSEIWKSVYTFNQKSQPELKYIFLDFFYIFPTSL